jgi:hypothetical protein
LGRDWAKVHDRIEAGYPEARHWWVYQNQDRFVHMQVYVASDAPATAWRRFLALGADPAAAKLPWVRLQNGPGERAAGFTVGDVQRLLWVRQNWVVSLRTTRAGFDISGLGAWVDALASGGTALSAPPPAPKLSASTSAGAVHSTMTVQVDCAPGGLIANDGSEAGLKLIAKTAQALTFQCAHPAQGDLHIIVTDPATLLSASAQAPFTVTTH